MNSIDELIEKILNDLKNSFILKDTTITNSILLTLQLRAESLLDPGRMCGEHREEHSTAYCE